MLWSRLVLLLWSRLVLLLWGCLVLLLRGCLVLLLWSRLVLLLLGCCLVLLLRGCLVLLLDRLMLLLLLSRLMLLLLLSRLMLLLLLNRLMLLLLLNRLMLLLLLLLNRLMLLLLLRGGLIARLQRRRRVDVAIGRKRLVDGQTGRAAMVDAGELSPVGAGDVLILQLRPHGRSMLFMARSQFSRSGSHLQPTRSAVETHTGAAPVFAHRVVVDVVYHGDVQVVDRAVVVEMAATPVAALIADTDIAKAVVDAAIVADMRTPVATVKAIAVVVVAPVAGGPESALVGSLNPSAGHPVVARWSIAPVSGRPQIVVTGSRRLVVVGQGRRRLRSVGHWLSTVAWIVRALVIGLVGGLVVRAPRAGWRSALLGGISRWRRAGVGCTVRRRRRSV